MEETETYCNLEGRTIQHGWDKNVVKFVSDGKAIGKMDVTMNENRACFIHNYEIEPRFRGKGLGRCLYNFMEEAYLEEKCDSVELASMPRKVTFWHEMGFEIDESRSEVGMTTPMIKNFGGGAGGLWL